MFRGVVGLLSGGISSARIAIFTKILTSHEGTVLKRIKTASLFKKSKKIAPLDPLLTHIIVENRQITTTELCNQLNCLDIPSTVKVVHCSWIEECAKRKLFLDPINYEIDLETIDRPEEEKALDDAVDTAPVKRSHSEDEVMGFESNRSKQSRVSEIRAMDLSTATFGEDCHELGNGWHLLHNFLDGQMIPSLLFRFAAEVRDCHRVVGFDMDGTIITTKSGATFAKDSSDWKFLYPDIPTQLQARHQAGAHLFIVSNQNGVNKGHVTVAQLMTKFDNIVSGIGLPMDIACAFASDCHRKPNTGAWEFLARNRFVDYAADETTRLSVLGQSMYVGDAAGRPKTRDRSKDFSSSDYKMALNLGIQVCPRPSVLFDHRAVPNSRTILSRLSSPD
jgi:DNA 3'-phosphatase